MGRVGAGVWRPSARQTGGHHFLCRGLGAEFTELPRHCSPGQSTLKTTTTTNKAGWRVAALLVLTVPRTLYRSLAHTRTTLHRNNYCNPLPPVQECHNEEESFATDGGSARVPPGRACPTSATRGSFSRPAATRPALSRSQRTSQG